VKLCPGIFQMPPLTDVAVVCRAGPVQRPSVLWGCMSQLQPRNRYQSGIRTTYCSGSQESTIKGSWVNSPKASLFSSRWYDPCVPLGSPPTLVCDRVTMKSMMLGQRSQVHSTPELLTQSHLLNKGHGALSLCHMNSLLSDTPEGGTLPVPSPQQEHPPVIHPVRGRCLPILAGTRMP
ncbi:hypothetical protein H1C71_042245, partial [Ictidomys tridecemlineatus]